MCPVPGENSRGRITSSARPPSTGRVPSSAGGGPAGQQHLAVGGAGPAVPPRASRNAERVESSRVDAGLLPGGHRVAGSTPWPCASHGWSATAGSWRATRCATAATAAVMCSDDNVGSASAQKGARGGGVRDRQRERQPAVGERSPRQPVAQLGGPRARGTARRPRTPRTRAWPRRAGSRRPAGRARARRSRRRGCETPRGRRARRRHRRRRSAGRTGGGRAGGRERS